MKTSGEWVQALSDIASNAPTSNAGILRNSVPDPHPKIPETVLVKVLAEAIAACMEAADDDSDRMATQAVIATCMLYRALAMAFDIDQSDIDARLRQMEVDAKKWGDENG